jgi:hypothetical protein
MLLGFSAFASESSTNLVRDVSCRQDGDKIVISYNLKKKADVDIFCSTDGGNTFKRIFRVSGDVGYDISPGNKEIVWNVLDERDILMGDVCFKVEAKLKTQPIESYNTKSSVDVSTAYEDYCDFIGWGEFTWFGLNTSLCTGFDVGFSLLRMRFGWFQLNPIEVTCGYDFLEDEVVGVFHPSVNFLIPTGYDGSVYFGGGFIITTSSCYDDIWFKAELGYRYHWGDYASSDFFMRYNGMFTIGVSIQWSSYIDL